MKNQTPADRQAELQKNGLIATADEMWRHPAGTFVLKTSSDPKAKRRRRIDLTATAR